MCKIAGPGLSVGVWRGTFGSAAIFDEPESYAVTSDGMKHELAE